MRMSGLSAATGVPVATIKYYLREGLLHQGERTGATQALYDESHVARLRLIRALLTVGGLTVAAVRDVLQSLEHDDVLEALATAQEGLSPKLADSLDLSEAQKAMAIRTQWSAPFSTNRCSSPCGAWRTRTCPSAC